MILIPMNYPILGDVIHHFIYNIMHNLISIISFYSIEAPLGGVPPPIVFGVRRVAIRKRV